MVLYFLVGMFSIMIMVIFLGYHRLVARKNKGKPVARCKCKSYVKLTIPPALYGIILAMIPVITINILIDALITGSIFELDTSLYECDNPSGTDSCPLTLFDNIKDDPSKVTVNYQILRTGRCGVSMLVVGIYLMSVGLTILIPDKSDEVSLYVLIF